MKAQRWNDQEQIDALWRALRVHVEQRVPNDDQADDVVQEAWLRSLVTPPEHRDRLHDWLRIVAERLILERWRSRRNRWFRERAVARPEIAPAADEEIEHGASRVLALVLELREPYRQVVRLRYVEGWEIAEIAQHLQRSQGTVRSQIKRGLDRLRARLMSERSPAADDHERRAGLLGWILIRLPRYGIRTDPEPGLRAPEADNGEAPSEMLLQVPRPHARVLRPSRWLAAGVAASFALFVATYLVHYPLRSDPRLALGVLPRARPASLVPVALEMDGSPVTSRASERVALEPARAVHTASATIDAPLGDPPIVLSGLVLYQKKGNAVAGARIHAESEGADHVVAVSNERGRFTARLSDFPVWVWAEHDAFAPTARKRVDRGFAESEAPLVLESQNRGRILGTVVGLEGDPIEDAEVRVGPSSPDWERRGVQVLLERRPVEIVARTGASGRFAAPAPASMPARLAVSAPGHRSRLLFVELAEAEVRIELARDSGCAEEPNDGKACGIASPGPAWRRCATRGSASDGEDGTAAFPARARELGALSASFAGRLTHVLRGHRSELDLRLESETLDRALRIAIDGDGNFEVGQLAMGSYDLFVEGGSIHGAWLAAHFELRTGERRDLGTVFLPAPGALRVRVRSPFVEREAGVGTFRLRGQGADLSVHFRSGGTGIEIDRARDTIEVCELWPGTYCLLAQGPRITDATATVAIVEAGTAEVELTPSRGCLTFVAARSPRRLWPDEQFEVRTHGPWGSTSFEAPTTSAGRASSVPGDRLMFHTGVPLDTRRIEIRSIYGLVGECDLEHVSRTPSLRIEIALHDGGDDPRSGPIAEERTER